MARTRATPTRQLMARRFPRPVHFILLAGLLVGIVGVLVIRRLAGPTRQIVDVAALDRRERVRRSSEQRVAEALDLLDDQQVDRAIELARQVTKDDPDYAAGQLLLGRLLLAAGRSAEAEMPAARALELDPDNPEAHFQMGYVHLLTRAGRGAVAEFKKAIELVENLGRPVPISYHLSLAEAYAKQAQTDLADRQVSRALAIDRDETLALCEGADWETLMLVGRALTRRGEHYKASELFIRAARLRPALAEPQYWAARSCSVVGKHAEALEFIDGALQLDPVSEKYRSLKEQIESERRGLDLPGEFTLK